MAHADRLRALSRRVAASGSACFWSNKPHAHCRCADIVPSLNENRILERWSGGVRLLQVAAQELAWGLKFSATATLDIEELPNGINAALRDG